MKTGDDRANGEKARRQSRILGDAPLLRQVLDAMPNIVAVVNDERRLVFANKSLLQLLGITNVDQVIGMRPGEALCCVHEPNTPHGCGTGEACGSCGAMLAIHGALRGNAVVQEARITRRDGADELDLRIAATPLTVNGDKFTVLAITDIGHEKRHEALQRAFLQQIIGSADRIGGFAEMLRNAAPREGTDGQTVYSLAGQLAQESGRLRELSAK